MSTIQEAPIIAVQQQSAKDAVSKLEDADKLLIDAQRGAAGLAKTDADELLAGARADAQELKAEAAAAQRIADDRVLQEQEASDRSMLNPFNTSKIDSFNIWFFLILVFNMFYGVMSWQGSQAYHSSGISPHPCHS